MNWKTAPSEAFGPRPPRVPACGFRSPRSRRASRHRWSAAEPGRGRQACRRSNWPRSAAGLRRRRATPIHCRTAPSRRRSGRPWQLRTRPDPFRSPGRRGRMDASARAPGSEMWGASAVTGQGSGGSSGGMGGPCALVAARPARRRGRLLPIREPALTNEALVRELSRPRSKAVVGL